MSSKASCISRIVDLGCFKTGEFTLSSGKQSSYYLDLRVAASSPSLLNDICILSVSSFLDLEGIDYVVGVPYGGIPYALIISRITNIPSLILRKERKPHGMKNIIEGLSGCKIPSECSVLVVDDVMTTGRSLDMAVETLKNEGFNVKMKHVIANMSGKSSGAQALFNLEDFSGFP